MTLLTITTHIALPDGLVGADADGNVTPETVAQLTGLVEAHLSSGGAAFRAVEVTVLEAEATWVRAKVQGRSARTAKKRPGNTV